MKILCPTDFSEPAARALDFATQLAAQLSASLEIVHVLQVPIYMGWEDNPAALAETARYIEESRAQADRELAALVEKAKKAGVSASARQLDGVPHKVISELSTSFGMIVMGTHGRTGISHLVLGSVAERVLRHAACPVLTVPAHERA